ncbi:conserved Plasmodium protein, unknown function [Plasmodium gaboni]|uniref:WD repeat-containing protein n=1 Tax=Plasmodium gaboni TaxID=647221 RepID=A0ABY1UHR1_9APIC|nr:conserved Plasmodium protein, unknown function [Plasmodium gaboni]
MSDKKNKKDKKNKSDINDKNKKKKENNNNNNPSDNSCNQVVDNAKDEVMETPEQNDKIKEENPLNNNNNDDTICNNNNDDTICNNNNDDTICNNNNDDTICNNNNDDTICNNNNDDTICNNNNDDTICNNNNDDTICNNNNDDTICNNEKPLNNNESNNIDKNINDKDGSCCLSSLQNEGIDMNQMRNNKEKKRISDASDIYARTDSVNSNLIKISQSSEEWEPKNKWTLSVLFQNIKSIVVKNYIFVAKKCGIPNQPNKPGPVLAISIEKANNDDSDNIIVQTPCAYEKYSLRGKLIQHKSLYPCTITCMMNGSIGGIGKVVILGEQNGNVLIYKIDKFECILKLNTKECLKKYFNNNPTTRRKSINNYMDFKDKVVNYYHHPSNDKEQQKQTTQYNHNNLNNNFNNNLDPSQTNHYNYPYDDNDLSYQISGISVKSTFANFIHWIIAGNMKGYIFVWEVPSGNIIKILLPPLYFFNEAKKKKKNNKKKKQQKKKAKKKTNNYNNHNYSYSSSSSYSSSYSSSSSSSSFSSSYYSDDFYYGSNGEKKSKNKKKKKRKKKKTNTNKNINDVKNQNRQNYNGTQNNLNMSHDSLNSTNVNEKLEKREEVNKQNGLTNSDRQNSTYNSDDNSYNHSDESSDDNSDYCSDDLYSDEYSESDTSPNNSTNESYDINTIHNKRKKNKKNTYKDISNKCYVSAILAVTHKYELWVAFGNGYIAVYDLYDFQLLLYTCISKSPIMDLKYSKILEDVLILIGNNYLSVWDTKTLKQVRKIPTSQITSKNSSLSTIYLLESPNSWKYKQVVLIAGCNNGSVCLTNITKKVDGDLTFSYIKTYNKHFEPYVPISYIYIEPTINAAFVGDASGVVFTLPRILSTLKNNDSSK